VAGRRYIGESGKTYEPIEHIGPGGFGAVERVCDEEGAEYALKTLHLGFDAQVLTSEIENLRKVQHANVVRYEDHGVDPEAFLVMEYADGGTLKDLIAAAVQAGEHLPIATLTEWAQQLLEGLSAIHDVLLHRDLKPANVLFQGETVKIGDFGMTRLVEASTRTETLKGGGTPLYMPPEGWAGPSGPSPTPAYDLYSAGVILYELATLQPPFTGSRDELRQAHLYKEPRSPRELREDIPPTLERLILQLLRKTPNDRGASADDALQLLELIPAQKEDGQAATSDVITKLQEGASSLMRKAAEHEAEQARARQELGAERELVAQANAKLDEILIQARDIVAQNVAPLQLHGGRAGRSFTLDESPRSLTIEFGDVRSAEFFRGAHVPGKIVCFGLLVINEGPPALGGANLVAFVREDAPWVIHLQEIQLRNNALVRTPMREYEPFFLMPHELEGHGPWLWGGAMHVYTPSHRELTVQALTEWFTLLVP
jgi:serine/threonine protein kinase